MPRITQTVCFIILLAFAGITNSKVISDGKFSLQIAPSAQWVKPIEMPALADTVTGSVRYVLVDSQHFQDTNGQITYFHQNISIPQTPQGLESESQITITFNSAYQTLQVHAIEILRNSHWIDKLQDGMFSFHQRETEASELVYTGEVSATLILKDIRLRDAIRVSYSVIGNNPVYDKKFFASEWLGWRVPVDRVYRSFKVPDTKKLYHKMENSDRELRYTHSNNYNTYSLLADAVPQYLFEDDYPDWYQAYPRLYVSEFKDWEAVRSWGTGLFSGFNSTRSDDIQTLVKQLKLGSDQAEEYTRRALEFVQDEVRYLSLSLGENSHRPHAPIDVLNNRYGDCKDKTLLLITLLNAAGIEAAPALVSFDYRSAAADMLPSPVFDHVIAKVNIGKNTYWLDPTRTFQRGSLQYRPTTGFGKALVLNSKQKGFENIPFVPEQFNKVDVVEEFDAKTWGSPVELTVTSRFRGLYAEYYRRIFANSSLGELQQNFQNYYLDFYDNVKALHIDYRNLPDNNEFELVERYRLDNFWQLSDDNASRRAYFYHTWIRDQIKPLNDTNRTTPLALSTPISLSNNVVILIPEDSDIGLSDTPNTSYSTKAFSYKAHESYTSGKYVTAIKLDIQQDYVDIDDIGSYTKYLDQIDNETSYSYNVDKPWSDIAREDTNKLLNRLREIGAAR